MKKIYENVEMSITEFETEDIITSSGHDIENPDLYGEESGTGEDGGEF